MSVPLGSPPLPLGATRVSGIFINGETLIPHAPVREVEPSPRFPLGSILDMLFQAASAHGHLIERVMVRNWSDSHVSGEVGPMAKPLQQHLVQLVHVPPADAFAGAMDAHYHRVDYDDIDDTVVARAARWSTAMRRHGLPVTVVLVGVEGEPELPDDVQVESISVVWASSGGARLDLDRGGVRLVVGVSLWP